MIEICLILLGVVTVIASFLIGEKISPMQELTKETVAEILETQIKDAEAQFHDAARQLSEDMQEATERELEKICNEKIMAIYEDSETTSEEIEKNHQEVVFLYGMLDEKRKELENLTISLRNETKETRELVQDLMLSKEITHMLKQEITIGRDAISELKRLREGTEGTLALAEERIEFLDERLIDLHQLDERLVVLQELDEKLIELQQVDEKLEELQILDERLAEFRQLDEKLAELQQVDERLAELQQADKKLAELQQLEEKLTELQQLDGKRADLQLLEEKLAEMKQLEERILLRQKEEKELEASIKKAERAAEKRAAARKKETKADDEAAMEQTVDIEDLIKAAEIDPEIVKEVEADLKKMEADSEAKQKSAPKRTSVRRKKSEELKPEEKETQLSGVKDAVQKKVSGLEAEENNFNQRILRMHRAGMTETEIARSLSLGVGEVRLVIGLFEGAKVGS